MKIISFDSGRVTWLFPIEEFAPAANHNPGSVLTAIAARYSFSRTPTITTRDDMDKNGLVFGLGHFQIGSETVGISDFIVYNDGIVAMAQKTEWAEAFLADLFNWVKENFGFRDLSVGIRKMYASTLVADFDSPLSGLVSNYEALSGIITSRTMTIMRDRKPMQFSRLDFEIDRRTLDSGQLALPKFVLERRVGIEFEQERWLSVAPMQTTQHVEVLAEIEVLAATTAVPVAARRPS